MPGQATPSTGAAGGEALLRCVSTSVHYGGVRALHEVDVEVMPGELVGVIGPNGAGKSTLLDAVSGFAPVTGAIHFAGTEIGNRRPPERARLGMARTWQTLQLFEDLTVAENVRVAAHLSHRGEGVSDLVRTGRDREAAVYGALEQLGIDHLADRMPGDLPHGPRVLVGVARALAAHPKMLLMDEPAAGLDGGERTRLGELLREVVEGGTAVVLVDHDMDLVLRICDRVYVLDFGVVIANGEPRQIQKDPKVIAAYLGTEDEETSADGATAEATK